MHNSRSKKCVRTRGGKRVAVNLDNGDTEMRKCFSGTLKVRVFIALFVGLSLGGAASAEPPAGANAAVAVSGDARDISGDWKFEITGRADQSGLVKLTRDATQDDDGFQAFTGPVTYKDGTASSKPWRVGVRGSDVSILTEFAVFTCAGSFDERGRIKARCKFLDDYTGTLLMFRVGDSESGR